MLNANLFEKEAKPHEPRMTIWAGQLAHQTDTRRQMKTDMLDTNQKRGGGQYGLVNQEGGIARPQI